MGKKDDIALISADGYTMYLYQTDGTLWYWNSDLITYHDDGRKGATLETWVLDYRGFFEEVDVGEILDREPDDPAIPKIVSISPGVEGALFLLQNGEVFVSGYVTTQIRDVEYIARYHSHPECNGPDVVHDFPLKGLDFRKLDYENIISISSNKDNTFYLVDKDGNIYCYQIEEESEPLETEQTVESVPPEAEQTVEQGDNWKAAYQNLVLKDDVKRMALLYLDEDNIPELLTLQDGEYHLYTFDGSQITEIDMPDARIKAKAYTPKHALEHSAGDLAFYWFEYVPYQGLIRVHSGDEGERCDYYLSYKNASFDLELEAKFTDYIWHTYNAKQEITNEEFLSSLSDLGYDQLSPCGFLYDNIEDAYENIGRTSSNREVLDDFVNGKIDALYEVEEITDIPEDGFNMRSYGDLYEEFIMGDGMGRMQYVDFDNDGQEELIMRDYMGNSIFLDVIGNTVYNVMEAYGTADQSHAAEMDGRRVIVSADVSHGGRKHYIIKQYDACGCLVDFFRLSASYDGKDHYSAEDEFKYRERPITLEEFEEIRDRIQDISTEKVIP